MLRKMLLSALLGMTLSICSTHAKNVVPPQETKKQHDARMAWWREARFGMFIHWGIYSVPAGIWQGQQIDDLGEWIMNTAKIPVKDYEKFADQFNPTQFDAEKIVLLAKNAGMKYIIITAKHHDGFAMYPSKVDRYNIFDASPFKRDPLKELAEACKKYNMKLGFYYSQSQDWHAPGGRASGGHWDPLQDGSMDEYIRTKSVPQVKELLTEYGPIAILWWDTPGRDADGITKERAEKFLPLLQLQPNIITNNRLGGGYMGDTETPEQEIPATGFPGRDWETCMTMNDTWGYKSTDHNWKSTETLLRNLIDIASKGGNYLLNIGPTSEGVVPEPSVERLNEIGKWMKVNGEAIYGTGPTAFGAEAGSTVIDENGNSHFVPAWEWRCTTKPGKLYIHIFKWPAGKFQLTSVKGKISKAYLLADPQHTPLHVVQQGESVTVTLPAEAPDPIASVMCLEMD